MPRTSGGGTGGPRWWPAILHVLQLRLIGRRAYRAVHAPRYGLLGAKSAFEKNNGEPPKKAPPISKLVKLIVRWLVGLVGRLPVLSVRYLLLRCAARTLRTSPMTRTHRTQIDGHSGVWALALISNSNAKFALVLAFRFLFYSPFLLLFGWCLTL